MRKANDILIHLHYNIKNKENKIALFKTAFHPVLLYGGESWSLLSKRVEMKDIRASNRHHHGRDEKGDQRQVSVGKMGSDYSSTLMASIYLYRYISMDI